MRNASALLVVDVQRGLVEGPGAVYRSAELLDRIRGLIERARARSVPVVFVQDDDVGGVGSAEWQIHPSIAPRHDELIVQKKYGDAFFHTSLHDELAARGVAELFVVGCKTDACVDITSRRAVSLGYDVTLVGDAHSTTDNRFMSADRSIEYYNLVLDGFGEEDGFGGGEHAIAVCSSGELLN